MRPVVNLQGMFEMHSKHFVLNELGAELCSSYFLLSL